MICVQFYCHCRVGLVRTHLIGPAGPIKRPTNANQAPSAPRSGPLRLDKLFGRRFVVVVVIAAVPFLAGRCAGLGPASEMVAQLQELTDVENPLLVNKNLMSVRVAGERPNPPYLFAI
jgi:hypothetical protein